MPAKWQRIRLSIPKDLRPNQREKIGQEIVDFIRRRTLSGKDKNGNDFAKYTQGYKKSLDFRNAGKSSRPNLKLSGDMLAALELLSHEKGSLLIGFESGSSENARADGNIRGTYGQARPTGKARDFLGIDKSDKDEIIEQFEED